MPKETDTIDSYRERIRDSAQISDADKEALIEFSEEMELLDTTYSDKRHIKLLQHCVVMAGDSRKYSADEIPDVDLVDTFHDESAVRDIARWIKRNYESEESKRFSGTNWGMFWTSGRISSLRHPDGTNMLKGTLNLRKSRSPAVS